MVSSPRSSLLSNLFLQIEGGSRQAESRLFDEVYDELRNMARNRMARESPGHTLQPTALVNEAYLRLVDDKIQWKNRAYFFAASAEAMRRILVDSARRRGARKRGGDRERLPLETYDAPTKGSTPDVLELDGALKSLEAEHERPAQVVKYRYFLGLTIQEVADLLSVSTRTVSSDWDFARVWLSRAIGSDK